MALCFGASSVHLSIGPRLFLPSGRGQCSTLLSVCLVFAHLPNKGLCPQVEGYCVHTVIHPPLLFLSFAPPVALCVSVSRGLITHSYVVLLNSSSITDQSEENWSRVIQHCVPITSTPRPPCILLHGLVISSYHFFFTPKHLCKISKDYNTLCNHALRLSLAHQQRVPAGP